MLKTSSKHQFFFLTKLATNLIRQKLIYWINKCTYRHEAIIELNKNIKLVKEMFTENINCVLMNSYKSLIQIKKAKVYVNKRNAKLKLKLIGLIFYLLLILY